MDKQLNGKDQLTDAEKRKQALTLLENWLQDLVLEEKNNDKKRECE